MAAQRDGKASWEWIVAAQKESESSLSAGSQPDLSSRARRKS